MISGSHSGGPRASGSRGPYLPPRPQPLPKPSSDEPDTARLEAKSSLQKALERANDAYIEGGVLSMDKKPSRAAEEHYVSAMREVRIQLRKPRMPAKFPERRALLVLHESAQKALLRAVDDHVNSGNVPRLRAAALLLRELFGESLHVVSDRRNVALQRRVVTVHDRLVDWHPEEAAEHHRAIITYGGGPDIRPALYRAHLFFAETEEDKAIRFAHEHAAIAVDGSIEERREFAEFAASLDGSRSISRTSSASSASLSDWLDATP